MGVANGPSVAGQVGVASGSVIAGQSGVAGGSQRSRRHVPRRIRYAQQAGAVGHHQDCPLRAQGIQRRNQMFFRFHVDLRSRLVKKQDSPAGKECSRQGDPLRLPTGNQLSSLPHLGFEGARHPRDLLRNLSGFQCGPHFALASIRCRKAQVVRDGARKEPRFLADGGGEFPQLGRIQGAQVTLVDRRGSAL